MSSWVGIPGRLGMTPVVPATIAPIIIWNCGLLVGNHGIRCGMSGLDVKRGMRLIKTLLPRRTKLLHDLRWFRSDDCISYRMARAEAG
jgi:hypothetical protein